MRHKFANKKLGRNVAHRKAMLRNQIISLITHNRIITTEAKAKETKRLAEKLITLARKSSDDKVKNLHLKRLAFEILNDRKLVDKLFNEIGPLYKERNGGYTRIYKLGRRAGDAAPMALLELVK